MKIVNLTELSATNRNKLLRRSTNDNFVLEETVRNIITEVKTSGDKALFTQGKKFYGKDYKNIRVSSLEISSSILGVDKKFIEALQQMTRIIQSVQKVQLKNYREFPVVSTPGVSVWREWRPIEKIGIYVPGGKAVYPSSVLMTAVPAQIAGCKNIIMCTPPGKNGNMAPEILVAANILGIKEVYQIGGAEAIAAMAYGTETVPRVSKIFGAGNSYVAIAKQLVQTDVAIDMPAGPSEVLIIADETANASWIAADLLADGEHGSDSACVLITNSLTLAKNVEREIEEQLKTLPTAKRVSESFQKYGFIGIVETIEDAVDFTNNYAPEHLEIMTRTPEKLVEKITNAGSVFLGDWTTKSAGDYSTGANHVLPTGGFAKSYAPLGVDSFGKWMQVQKCTKAGLARIRKTIEIIAEAEQLPAHRKATEIRFLEGGDDYGMSKKRTM